MKKIVRVTESDIRKIVKRVVSENDSSMFYRRRLRIFEKYLDEILQDVSEEYDAEDFNDFMEEVQWRILTYYEDQYGEVEDVEGFFDIVPIFKDKIRDSYRDYKKNKR